MDADANADVTGTTRGLPSGRDYDHFCDSIAEVYIGVRPRRPESGRFAADFALYDLDPFHLGWVSTPGVSAQRDRSSLRAVADDAVFLNHSAAGWGLVQHGNTWDAPAGSALVLDNAASFTVVADPKRPLRLATLRIPRERLTARTRAALPSLDDRLSGTREGMQLGAQLALLLGAARAAMPAAARVMGEAVVEMLDAFSASEPRHASRLESMRLYAQHRMHDPGFDLSALARAFHCSTRTVQAEFAATGTTFSSWLRERRLDAARSALQSPDRSDRSVAAVARAHGFADVGTFHRAYRARFGRTPAADR
ncbi:AraC family transcriptional regulator [Microbacterium sp. GXF7504]